MMQNYLPPTNIRELKEQLLYMRLQKQWISLKKQIEKHFNSPRRSKKIKLIKMSKSNISDWPKKYESPQKKA